MERIFGDDVGNAMKLLWLPDNLPRTMTRREWRDLNRWKRVQEKELRQAEAEAMKAAIALGRPDMLDRIVNPPLLVHGLMRP